MYYNGLRYTFLLRFNRLLFEYMQNLSLIYSNGRNSLVVSKFLLAVLFPGLQLTISRQSTYLVTIPHNLYYHCFRYTKGIYTVIYCLVY